MLKQIDADAKIDVSIDAKMDARVDERRTYAPSHPDQPRTRYEGEKYS
jgi:hypothetical protein